MFIEHLGFIVEKRIKVVLDVCFGIAIWNSTETGLVVA